MANSKVEVLEAKGSRLRKDLIVAMDDEKKLKKQVKALTDELRVKKLLTMQKDEQIQVAKQEVGSAGAKAVQAY